MNNNPSAPPSVVAGFRVTGRRAHFFVQSYINQNILSLKMRIQEIVCVEAARQALMFGNQALENNRTIGSYGFRTDSYIPVMLIVPAAENPAVDFPIEILDFITANKGASYSLMVKETTTVAELRIQVAEILEVLETQIVLSRGGNWKLDQNHLTVYDYYIGSGAYVMVLPLGS